MRILIQVKKERVHVGLNLYPLLRLMIQNMIAAKMATHTITSPNMYMIPAPNKDIRTAPITITAISTSAKIVNNIILNHFLSLYAV